MISCRIPRFQEISKEQLALLRESLKRKRSEKLVDDAPVPDDVPGD